MVFWKTRVSIKLKRFLRIDERGEGMAVLVTGGLGFIGTHLSDYYLKAGERVIVLDNFSRKGTDLNARWLQEQHGEKLRIVRADIRTDQAALQDAVNQSEAVFHLAAQVAVTNSLADPREDFEINLGGTFNLLESVRSSPNRPFLLYASTNKVYGSLDDLHVQEERLSYTFEGLPRGVDEGRPLDFHTPYGCSKGAADQYVRDYARGYGLDTVVFRQSCIYGTRQFGVEDQGWVAHFVVSILLDRPLNIFGNGKQVRDVLYIDDLIELMNAARENQRVSRGQVYNVGGGPENTLSLLQLIRLMEKLAGKEVACNFLDMRAGDQLMFIADISKAKQHFQWMPRVSPDAGIERLMRWVKENKPLFQRFYGLN